MKWPLALCCLLAALPAPAQKPPSYGQKPGGMGVLSGAFTTGVTPEDRQVAQGTQIFVEAKVRGNSWRYPCVVVKDAPGHFFRFACKAKALPTDVLLSDIRLILVEPGGKESFCAPANFDGRAVLLSSPKALVSVEGWKRRATRPGRIPASEARVECPTGLRSLSGLKFVWNVLK